MNKPDYKKIFVEEVRDRLARIEKELVNLEKTPFDGKVQESLFRHYHSIKGMCASMGYKKMMRFAHAQEGLLTAIREKRLRPSEEIITILFSAMDVLKEMTDRIEQGLSTDDIDTTPIVTTLENALKGTISEPPATSTAPSTQHLKPHSTIKVEGWVFDELLRLTAGLITVFSELKDLSATPDPFRFRNTLYRFEKNLKELNSHILSARLVPLSLITDGLPRVVRDLSRQMKKKAEIIVEGAEIRLDKSILEALSDTLVHIIRNALDHGIEPPQERVNTGKPETGRITVRAMDRKDTVLIEVIDDGRGIDRERLINKAIESGVKRERIDRMSDEEILLLVCTSGLSLKEEATEVSGRGVGMDAVRDRILSIGGRLSISSSVGRGTSIIMELPRMASIMRVLFVGVGTEEFAIPVKDVEGVIEAPVEWVDKGRVIFREQQIPARMLADILAMPYNKSSHTMDSVVLSHGEKRCALFVDTIKDEAEAYVKPLPQPTALIKGIKGYIVGADGHPILVIDTHHVVRSIET